MIFLGGSPGLVAMGVDSCSKGHGLNPGAGPIKILQRKIHATQFFKHSDWILKIFNQSKCLKNSVV